MSYALKLTSSRALTAFFFPYCFFEPLSNALLVKYKPSVWLPSIMVAWGKLSVINYSADNCRYRHDFEWFSYKLPRSCCSSVLLRNDGSWPFPWRRILCVTMVSPKRRTVQNRLGLCLRISSWCLLWSPCLRYWLYGWCWQPRWMEMDVRISYGDPC